MALARTLAAAAVATLVANGAYAVGVSTTDGTASDPETLLPSTDASFAQREASAGEAIVKGAKVMPKTIDTAAAPTEDQMRTHSN